MLISDLITEYAIARFQPAPEIMIIVDNHYLDRFKERGVGSHRTVALMLHNMGKIIPKLSEIGIGDEFWLYKPEFEVALGMRRNFDKNGKMVFALVTVVPDHPHMEGVNTVITI